ncbi:TonB-dependent receptor plug domain-containing protein [Pontibacter locisalis]|uniref:TonB-dependent receptor plug domain-containing protein n=1 Tax=Pontibacter locisalis TaxID=1719035 RepID=A0ABW5IGV9_9BACT
MAKLSFFKVCLAACCSLIVSFAIAQQDTSRHQLQVVEVFGKPAEVYAAGSRVTHLDSTYLSTYASGSLAEALQARTPVYLKSYGVSGISSVAFRGTNASQTAVLWNGLNISSPALGQTDFSTLPISGFGEVALQYGSAAANYGSGAIGGAVLISSPNYKSKGIGAAVQLETGSFDRLFGTGTLSFSNQKLQVGVSAYTLVAENNFSYKDISRFGKPEVKQENAAFNQHGFTQDISWHLSPKSKLAFHTWFTKADREIQPAMGSAYNSAKQQDESLKLMSEFTHDSYLGQTIFKAAYFTDYLHYTDLSTDSEANVLTYQLQAEQVYAYAERWSLRGGLNLQHFSAKNDGYTGQQNENRAAAFALFRYNPLKSLKVSLNLRQAFVEAYSPRPTPAFGLEWKFYNSNKHQISFKGNTSGSYRVPTLNDRFWIGAGNPELKPEQGWSYESGLCHVLVKGNALLWETEATAYHMLIDDWIQWSPDNTGRWRPTNLQKVVSKGIELSTRASVKLGQVNVSSSAGYTYTVSEQADVYEGSGDKGKQLMYVPRHKAVFVTDATYKGWTGFLNLNFTGLRYTNNSETNALDNFLLLNLALSKKMAIGQNTLILGVRSENVANTVYQTMAYRAMPPRSWALNIKFIIP